MTGYLSHTPSTLSGDWVKEKSGRNLTNTFLVRGGIGLGINKTFHKRDAKDYSRNIHLKGVVGSLIGSRCSNLLKGFLIM